MASEYTPNYNLDLYVSTDKPNLRDQYNGAMGKIDRALLDANNKVVDYGSQVANLTTRVVNVENDANALNSTVETHGTQLAQAQKDADDALALARTNERGIAEAEKSITALQGQNQETETSLQGALARIESVEEEKAPDYHASSSRTYGIGGSNVYGHVKLADTGTGDVGSGTAATPKMVTDAVRSEKAKIVMDEKTSIDGLKIQLAIGSGFAVCTLYKSAASYVVPRGDTVLATIPEQYRHPFNYSLSCLVNTFDSNNVIMFAQANGNIAITSADRVVNAEQLTGQIVWALPVNG